MKVAIIGSRNLQVENLEDYLPTTITEIVSGGAIGIDTCARNYATIHQIPLREFLPDYKTYGRRAPLIRNLLIIDYADIILAFWDGESHGTRFVIQEAKKRKKKVIIYKAVK